MLVWARVCGGICEVCYYSESDNLSVEGAALWPGFIRSGWDCAAGESLISGVTGEEFSADIYIGPVYYQRLRHMVSDKFQVGCMHSLYCSLLTASILL